MTTTTGLDFLSFSCFYWTSSKSALFRTSRRFEKFVPKSRAVSKLYLGVNSELKKDYKWMLRQIFLKPIKTFWKCFSARNPSWKWLPYVRRSHLSVVALFLPEAQMLERFFRFSRSCCALSWLKTALNTYAVFYRQNMLFPGCLSSFLTCFIYAVIQKSEGHIRYTFDQEQERYPLFWHKLKSVGNFGPVSHDVFVPKSW